MSTTSHRTPPPHFTEGATVRNNIASDDKERDIIIQRAIQRALLARENRAASSSVRSIAHDILLGCALATPCILTVLLVMMTLNFEYQGLAVEHARDSLREVASLMLATVCNPFFIVFVICATASYLGMRHFGIECAVVIRLAGGCVTAFLTLVISAGAEQYALGAVLLVGSGLGYLVERVMERLTSVFKAATEHPLYFILIAYSIFFAICVVAFVADQIPSKLRECWQSAKARAKGCLENNAFVRLEEGRAGDSGASASGGGDDEAYRRVQLRKLDDKEVDLRISLAKSGSDQVKELKAQLVTLDEERD